MKKKLYWERKNAGLCTECGTEDKDDDDRLCKECYAKDRKSKLKYYFKNKEELDEKRRKLRRKNYREGNCDDCGEPGQNTIYCTDCTKKRNARKKRRRAKKREMRKTNLDFSIELRELFTH